MWFAERIRNSLFLATLHILSALLQLGPHVATSPQSVPQSIENRCSHSSMAPSSQVAAVFARSIYKVQHNVVVGLGAKKSSHTQALKALGCLTILASETHIPSVTEDSVACKGTSSYNRLRVPCLLLAQLLLLVPLSCRLSLIFAQTALGGHRDLDAMKGPVCHKVGTTPSSFLELTSSTPGSPPDASWRDLESCERTHTSALATTNSQPPLTLSGSPP